MHKTIRYKNGVIEYLATSGILETGDRAAIAKAKSEYWKGVRKAWKQAKRRTHKSYTVYFTPFEIQQLQQYANPINGGIAGFIKRSTLNAAEQTPLIQKQIIGLIRQELYNHFNGLNNICAEQKMTDETKQKLLNKATLLQEIILLILQSSIV